MSDAFKLTEEPAIYSVRIDFLAAGDANGVNRIAQAMEWLLNESPAGEEWMRRAGLKETGRATFSIDWKTRRWWEARQKKVKAAKNGASS